MIEVRGKYGMAKIYASVVDDKTIEQIKELLNQKFTKDLSIRVMADCHTGKGCVIGTTIAIQDCCVPNLVGVDIGCGMLTIKLGKLDIDLVNLDNFIRKNIPAGTAVYSYPQELNTNLSSLKCFPYLTNERRINLSIGTLGGGNHFIEIDKDDEENLYLVIHTGSRNLGTQVCDHYMHVAREDFENKKRKNIKSLIARYKRLGKANQIDEGITKLNEKYDKVNKSLLPVYKENFTNYIHDMLICQEYARENREKIAEKILNFLGFTLEDFKYFHTIHNYINEKDQILRKGAISAHLDEIVLIPINMRDGAIIAKGMSNEDYNYSAPHGAGRILSRQKAKEVIALEDFQNSMNGIYSTSVKENTLDESPFAYKSIDDIIPNILPTVSIVKIIKPIYNFKAS